MLQNTAVGILAATTRHQCLYPSPGTCIVSFSGPSPTSLIPGLQEEEKRGSGRITMVIVRGFYMMYSPMDNKWRVYNSIRLPPHFSGVPRRACMITRPFLLLLLKVLGTRLHQALPLPGVEAYHTQRNYHSYLATLLLV